MKRRNTITNVSVQHALERNTTQLQVSNSQNAVKEFLRHCRIKGLSTDTVKFYDKERLKDVSFDGKGTINVEYAKNRYARRIPLTKRLREVLKAYIQERGVLDTDILFISVHSKCNPRCLRIKNASLNR